MYSKIVASLVDIKAGETLIRRFKREPHTLLYHYTLLVHDRDTYTEAVFPIVTSDVYRLLKSSCDL